METIKPKWDRIFKVHSYEVDIHKKLTIPWLCNYFQECAWEHAEHLDFGYTALSAVNKFWVLSRIHIEVDEYPLWGDEIKVTTWPKGLDGMFAIRDYLVTAADGRKLAAATTSWLILDAEKHRPQRIVLEELVKFKLVDDNALLHHAEKLPKPEQAVKIDDFRVKYSDIDVNHHANNAKLVRWAIDGLPADVLLNSQIKTFTINFIAESKLGNSIVLWREKEEDGAFLISLVNESSGTELCRVRIISN